MLVQCAVLSIEGRSAYLAGGIEVTTLFTVEVTVMAGGVDTEVTVEGGRTEVMVTSWVVTETSTIAGG